MLRRRLGIVAVVSIVSAGSIFAAAVGEKPISKFTSTARKNAVRFHRERDDPSSFRGLYRGFAGYELEFVGGDERSWIEIRYQGASTDLRDATMELGAGIGFFPHKANDTVEWRGIEQNGQFMPYAVIYRIQGLTENGKPDETRLVIVYLNKGRSRIVGHADGANAEAEAEQIADRIHDTK